MHPRFRPLDSMPLVIVAVLLAQACAGEPGKEAPPAGEAGVDDAPAEPPAAASIRIVNLWVEDGSPAAIDVRIEPMLGEQRPLFENVAFGATTSATGIPADVRLDVYRPGESGRGSEVGWLFLSGSDLEAADRFTIVVSYHRPLTEGGSTAGFDVFHDTGESIIGSVPARSVDGALLVAFVSPLNRVLGDARASLTFGIPGQGCLRPAGSPPPAGGITTSIGGTAAVAYDVPSGTHSIAAWDSDGTPCEGAPRVGPIEVDVAAEGRTWVFAHATGPDDLRLVAVGPSKDP